MKWLFSILLYFPFIIFGQAWEEISPVPGNGRDDATAFAIDGFGYIVNGSLNGFTGSNNLWCYNPATNSWAERAPFPGTPRQYAGSFMLNNEGYVLCGVGAGDIPVNDCWKYNPKSNSWIRIADLPAPARWSVFSFASAFAGYLGSGSSSNGLLNDVWKYSPNTNSWTQLTDFPGGKCRETASFSLGEKAVVTLGYDENYDFIHSTFEFNMFSETWQQTADFPGEGRAYATGGSTHNFGYIAGGTTKETVFFNDVVKYDFTSGTWSEAGNLPINGIRGTSSFTINGTLFFSTGLDADANRNGRGWKLVNEPGKEINVLVFPNPSSGTIIVKAENGSSIRLLTPEGKLCQSYFVSYQNTLWIDQLNPGSYIVEIVSEGSKKTSLLVVN